MEKFFFHVTNIDSRGKLLILLDILVKFVYFDRTCIIREKLEVQAD